MSIKELFTILLSDKPSTLLKENEEELFKLIPELERCKGFNQNNEWHIYDVYEHILHVVDSVPNDITILLAALFHDIGKPISYTEDENKVGHFYGHWEVSKKIFEEFANKYNIDNKELISNLIYYHDKHITKEDNIYLFFNKDELNMLYNLKRADLLAQNSKYHYQIDNINQEEKEILDIIN